MIESAHRSARAAAFAHEQMADDEEMDVEKDAATSTQRFVVKKW